MRVLVCGGRDFTDRKAVFDALDDLERTFGIDTIIEGGATGADQWAHEWAKVNSVVTESFPVSASSWRAHGKAAGPMRNKRMLVEGRPDKVLAFPGGRGTADMKRQAKAAGIAVEEKP